MSISIALVPVAAGVPSQPAITAATPASVEKINLLAENIHRRLKPQPFVTEHDIHGGMYTRTVRLPAGTVCAAALIKPPTILIVHGSCSIYSNDDLTEVDGYTVFRGVAGRKIAFITHSDVEMSMIFPTAAKTVDEAQREFTDEFEKLMPLSVTDAHVIRITGE